MANELTYLFPEELRKRLEAQRAPASEQELVSAPYSEQRTTTVTEAPVLGPEQKAAMEEALRQAAENYPKELQAAGELLSKKRKQAEDVLSAAKTESSAKIQSALDKFESDGGKEMSMGQMFAQALIGLAPSLLGAAVGKSMKIGTAAGGLAGAQAGLSGLKQIEESEAKREERQKAVQKAKLEALLETEKERVKPLQQEVEYLAKEQAQLPALSAELTAKMTPEQLKQYLEIQKASTPKRTETGITEKGFKTEKIGKPGSEKPKLGPGEQAMATTLGRQYASRSTALSEIDSTISLLKDPKTSKDQKIVAFEALFKRLNDPANSDAVQKAEADRLGPFVKFNMFNLTQPGPVFGRSLDEAVKQLALSRSKIAKAAEDARTAIAEVESGKGIPQIPQSPEQQKTGVNKLSKELYNKMTSEERKNWLKMSAQQQQELLKAASQRK